MPSPARSGMHQKAVLVSKTGTGPDGEALFSDPPEELNVRWEGRQRQGFDANGNPVALEADVKVDREVEIGSLLWLGALKDWDDAKENGEVSGVMEVKTVESYPDVKGREVSRYLGLVRFRGTLPEGV